MLINITHISNRRDLSANQKNIRYEQHIRDAEQSDLKPLLGEKFYNDVVNNADQEAYRLLLEGGTYEYEGFTYRFEGLRAVLSEFAYARIVMFGNYVSTAFGLTEKQQADSANADRAARKEIYKASQQAAVSLWADVAIYLDRVDSFEHWEKHMTGSPFGRLKLNHIR